MMNEVMVKEDDVKNIVKESVNQTLVSLGFTVDDPAEMQQDMHHLRKIRKGSADINIYVRRCAIWAVICTGAYIGLEGAKAYLKAYLNKGG